MAGDGPKRENAAEHFALVVWMKTEFTFESNSVVSHFFNGYPELNIGVMFQLKLTTLQGTNISPKNGILKMIFLFPRWDMLIPWRVSIFKWLVYSTN